jgi:transglutaminase-like putative cysteine protease
MKPAALNSPLLSAPGLAPGPAPSLVPAIPPPAVTLEVRHDTTYRYTSPVTEAQHLAHLQPLHDAHQTVLAFDLHIAPAPASQQANHDAHGNVQHHFSLLQPHSCLQVTALSRVRLQPRFAALQPGRGPAWDALAQRLRYVARAPFEPAVGFVQPSPYVPRLAGLREWARPEMQPGRPVAEAAIALMCRLHAEFRYESESTEVDTPLAQAFAQRRGVCQDFAHLLCGALRMWGLPVRYVSGYLLTRPADGEPPLLGADASHAWVQVWCPGTPGVPDAGAGGPAGGWLDLDPTNNLVPGTGHVRVAVGRDFGDVTPLRGVIRGGGSHTLEVGVTTRVVAG